MIFGQRNDEFDCLAPGIPEQVDVGREVNVGFKNIGVTFGDNFLRAVFFLRGGCGRVVPRSC